MLGTNGAFDGATIPDAGAVARGVIVGMKAAAGGGALGLGAGGAKTGLAALTGRSVRGRGGGIGAGRDRPAAGSIARRNAGTGGMGEDIVGIAAGRGIGGGTTRIVSGAASGSYCRITGAGAGAIGCNGAGSRRGITVLDGFTWLGPKL